MSELRELVFSKVQEAFGEAMNADDPHCGAKKLSDGIADGVEEWVEKFVREFCLTKIQAVPNTGQIVLKG